MTTHDDQERAAEPTVAGPQSEAAVAPASEVYAVAMPTMLSEEQRQMLVAVLDRIVPPNGALPGAGGLGVDAAIDRTLAQTPRLRRLFLRGLAEIAVTAERETGQDFLALDAATQERVLRAVEEAEPAFFAALVEHTYRGYYVRPGGPRRDRLRHAAAAAARPRAGPLARGAASAPGRPGAVLASRHALIGNRVRLVARQS